MTEKSMMDWKL